MNVEAAGALVQGVSTSGAIEIAADSGLAVAALTWAAWRIFVSRRQDKANRGKWHESHQWNTGITLFIGLMIGSTVGVAHVIPDTVSSILSHIS